ncbi:ShKT domain-containing protein [Caenorhabditis elegans]|uniref:ShKT domain-containing protein n=1 Tax=Caenorhabditis elegans TaxID=6239 RepID=O45452_CAEEL|nr:ShKT domain-containing protein [Caenorhabditis elegans]CAB04295.1 ShKT domain-containing protein [Caenorhabditis elegans]|eukprot:NP_506981.1 Uncharacterized protein CELE_F35E8.6 [Caenorhabditis elegans]
MMTFFLPLIAILFTSQLNAVIVDDFACTTNTAATSKWLPSSTVCSNVISDAACTALYPVGGGGAIVVGGDNARPFICYRTGNAAGAVMDDIKADAISICPKSCGYCCETSAYNCPNAALPSIDCSKVTPTQCKSPAWRPVIAAECPSACGFCSENGCIDAVKECANDITICNAVNWQDFVNKNCQKTCKRCPATTAAPAAGVTTTAAPAPVPVVPTAAPPAVVTTAAPATCTSYMPDSTTKCAEYARNGFCTSTMYTQAAKKASCATTCKIC